MNVRNTSTSYGSIARFFHWLVFVLVVGQLLGGFYATNFVSPSLSGNLVFWHKSFGLTILWLMLLRLIWASTQVQLNPSSKARPWERFLAKSVHYALYVFLIALPLSGWIMSTAADKSPHYFGLLVLKFPLIPINPELAKLGFQAHKFMACIVVGLIILHVLAALKHWLINRDGVFERMLRG